MAIVQVDDAHVQAKPHDGKLVKRLRSVTPDDGEAFDKLRAKTVCELPDGSEAIFWNTELQPSKDEV